MPVEHFVEIFGPVKPHSSITRRPRADRRRPRDLGCDLDHTYFDVPRLRGVTSDGYLTAGVGYAHHPSRHLVVGTDGQLNWWLPIYPYAAESSMAFFPRYFDETSRTVPAIQLLRMEQDQSRVSGAAHSAGLAQAAQGPASPSSPVPRSGSCALPGAWCVSLRGTGDATVPNTSGRSTVQPLDFRTVNLPDLPRAATPHPTSIHIRRAPRCTTSSVSATGPGCPTMWSPAL